MEENLGENVIRAKRAVLEVVMKDYFSSLEKKYNLPANLLHAVAMQESRMNPMAVSKAGAQGMFQFMPDTAKAYEIDPFDPYQSADGAARMYRDLLKQYNGDVELALAGYNWGSGNIQRKGMENMPEETRNYIKEVQQRMGGGPIGDGTKLATLEVMNDGTDHQELTRQKALAIAEAESMLDEETPTTDQIVEVNPEEDKSFFDEYIKPFGDTFEYGLDSARDFVHMDYPETQDLPFNKILREKIKDGNADRLDYQRAFLEAMENNPGGKAIGAAAGMIPSLNILTTTIGNWINPLIEEATGADPSTIALTEMAVPAVALGTKGVVKGKKTKDFIKDASSDRKNVMSELGIFVDEAPKSGIPELDFMTSKTKIGFESIKDKVENPIGTLEDIGAGTTKIAKKIINPVADSYVDRGGKGLREGLLSDTAKEGLLLEKRTPGLEFTASELTGSPKAKSVQDAFANSPDYVEAYAIRNQRNADAVINRYNKVLDRVYSKGVDPENVGQQVSSAYRNTIDNLIKTRQKQAAADFKVVKENKGINDIPAENLYSTLEAIIDEGGGILKTKENAHAKKLAESIKQDLTRQTEAGNTEIKNITIKDLQDGLKNYGESARRPGSPLEDAATAAERRVYSQLFGALQKDLDAAASNPKLGDKAAALKIARDNFRQYSKQIGDIEMTTIGKMVGKAKRDSSGNLQIVPEQVVAKVEGMKPSQLRSTIEFLETNSPEAAGAVRRQILENALNKSIEAKGQRGGETMNFGKSNFVKNLPDDAKLDALFGGDKKAIAEIKEIGTIVNRMIDWGSVKSGSQTAERQLWFTRLKEYGADALYRSALSDKLAEDMLNPKTRMKMMKEAEKIKAEKPEKKGAKGGK